MGPHPPTGIGVRVRSVSRRPVLGTPVKPRAGYPLSGEPPHGVATRPTRSLHWGHAYL